MKAIDQKNMIDYGNLQKLVECLDKIYLNYEVLWTEIWNMSPKIFLKDEIWALYFLSLKL